MSDKLVRIKNRYDTAENWETENPILATGELGIDSTNNIIKVGNGSSNWNELISCGKIQMIDNHIPNFIYTLNAGAIASMACGYSAVMTDGNVVPLNPMRTIYVKGNRTDMNTPSDDEVFPAKLFYADLEPDMDDYDFIISEYLDERPEYDAISCFYSPEFTYNIQINRVRIDLIGYESIEAYPSGNHLAHKYELRSCTDANENTKIDVYIGTHSVIFPSAVSNDICIYIER